MAEVSQYHRNYQVFKDEVKAPFDFVKLLSNGDIVGKCYHDVDGGMTLEEIEEYIKLNHIEELEEWL